MNCLQITPRRVDFEGSVDRDIGSIALTYEHAGEHVDVTSVSSFVAELNVIVSVPPTGAPESGRFATLLTGN